MTAVDVEDVTRDEPGFVRRDEHDAVGDLLGEAESTQRNLRREGRLVLRSADHIVDVILLANVGVDEFGLGTKRPQLLDEFLADFIATAGNDYLGAFLGEGNGRGAAYAR